ncbi:hypothetical protein FVEN_g13172 [Fusarium venenatum]|nr:hypothetical protein FVEN_g13172 [Fusarium venenatum]
MSNRSAASACRQNLKRIWSLMVACGFASTDYQGFLTGALVLSLPIWDKKKNRRRRVGCCFQ